MSLVRDLGNEGSCVCSGAGAIRKISVLSVQFCYEPKIGLQKVYLKGKKNEFIKIIDYE